MEVNFLKYEIVTIQSNNYGNRLQNYALQHTLEGLGLKVSSNLPVSNILKYKIKTFIKCILKRNSFDLFSLFNYKNIRYSFSNINKSMKAEKDVFYIAGSDQIWNPLFPFNSSREFLIFAPSWAKTAYGGSFGVSSLDDETKCRYYHYLKDFDMISVREDSAADLVESLTGKRPPVVLDPTLLLSKEEWNVIVRQSKLSIKQPFVVKYLLGIRDDRLESQIDEFAKKNNFMVVDITKTDEFKIGPAEFLYLLKNSEYNFLDSFHGTVFSIIFEKNFFTFSRPDQSGFGDMNSRFATLFSLTGLGERYVTEFDKSIPFVEDIDFQKAKENIEMQKEFSMGYLKRALGIKDE